MKKHLQKKEKIVYCCYVFYKQKTNQSAVPMFYKQYHFRRSINMSQINAALVIPSLNPDKKIMQVIRQTVDQGFSTILVVDDGSDTAHKQIFQTLCQTYPQITLLTHPKNLGKGEGLKTAFRYYLEHFAGQARWRCYCRRGWTTSGKRHAACALEMLQKRRGHLWLP